MSDISQSSRAAITQALTQLSQVAPTSEAARQGIEVLVKHLAGNVLSLSKSNNILNKSVLLAAPQIKGNLAEGQTHRVKLTLENAPALTFFSNASPLATSTHSLSDQQLQSLLNLPAKQLVANSSLTKPEILTKLPALNATVVETVGSKQANQVNTELLKSNALVSPIPPKENATVVPQNSIKLSLEGKSTPIDISLPIKQLNQFNIGEKVSISIVPKSKNWQITITQNNVPAEYQSNSSPATIKPKPQITQLSSLAAIPLIKASLSEASPTKSITVELPIKPVLQQLNKIESNQNLIQKIQALPIEKLALQINPNNEIELLVQNQKPVANIAITKEIAQGIIPLKLPNQQILNKLLDGTQDLKKQPTISPDDIRTAITPDKSKPVTNTKTVSQIPAVDGPTNKVPLQVAKEELLSKVQQQPNLQSMITPNLLANKAQQLNVVQSLLRIVQPKAVPPAVSLQSVEKALIDTEFFKNVPEQPTKQLVEQVLQQVKQALPQGREQDASQIRQLLSTPALNLSSLQMVNPTSNQGFMSGLVTLLQMSLSARLSRSQSSRSEQIASTLNQVMGATTKGKSTVTPRAMGDLSQLDQKHQLMKEIGRLFSGHQANKLGNAEQLLQGQDTFYYNLPSALAGNFKEIELLIKREDNHKQETNSEQKDNKTWQLTMKLGVGELGELLTKAKLHEDTLEINFYASNDAVKIQVMNFLPLLRKKFDSLGIQVSKSQCQLGKIPDTLQQRPYHTFQTQV